MKLDLLALEKIGPFLKGEIWFNKYKRLIKIIIEANSIAEVTEKQKKAIENFEKWNNELFERMEEPLFKYYQNTLKSTGSTEPVIGSSEKVWDFINPGTIVIPEDINENNYIFTEFGCEWEKEHGLTITIKNGNEVVYVGPFDDTTYFRDGKDKNGDPMYGNYV